MLSYIEDITAHNRLEKRIRFGLTVETVRWNDGAGVWHISVCIADGTQEQLEADLVLSDVGVLNQPKVPAFPGLESFTGPVFHSAEWDRDFDPSGKRIAVVGGGASANQIVPEKQQGGRACHRRVAIAALDDPGSRSV